MLFLPYVVIIFYILFGKKKDKFTWVLAASTISFLSITSYLYADIVNYMPLFEFINNFDISFSVKSSGLGWIIINKIFYFIGFNYRGLILGLIYFNFYLMHLSAKKLEINENIYFGLYLIFPGLIQLVQIKFFTATCIVMFGYTLMLTSDRFPKLKFIMSILIATTIHTSSVMYLLLILPILIKINEKQYIFFVFGITAIAKIFLNNIISIVILYLNSRLSERYITNSISPTTLQWFVAIFYCWLMLFIISFYILNNTKAGINDKFNILGLNYQSNLILLLTLVFLTLDKNFHRFLELGYLLLYFSLGLYIKPPKYSYKKLLLILILIIILVIVSLIYCPIETVIKPLFSYDGIINIRRN